MHEDRERAIEMATERLSTQYNQDFSKLVSKYALAGDPDDCVARLRQYVEAGARTIVLNSACTSDYVPRNEELLAESSGRFAAPSPEDELLRRESNAMLREALDKLTTERRTALLLRLDHQLGYPEIGDVMDWSPSKVKNEIHRARLQLRDSLKSYLRGVS